MNRSTAATPPFPCRSAIASVAVGLIIAALAVPAPAADSPGRGGINFFRNLSSGLLAANGRNHSNVKRAFRPVVRQARKSTVRILCDDRDTLLGTIVDARGYIVTKKSELSGQIECVLSDRRRFTAKRGAADDDYDLQLLKIDATRLEAIQWSTESPAVGAWLATVGPTESPVAVGFASADPRRIPAPSAVLGIQMKDADEGPQVTHVFRPSAAYDCNLEEMDIIQKINGNAMKNIGELERAISQMRAGDRVRLEVMRSGERFQAEAVLGDRARLGNKQAEIMEDLAGPLSARRVGFPLALQHDTLLKPRMCGGPLVDLSGKAVGINIARASRVASYAIPASAIQSLLPSLIVR